MREPCPLGYSPIIVPKRGKRPISPGVCPFCPGNEAMTPPELARWGKPWRVRVVPNLYPATRVHEVIIETPDHDADWDSLSEEHMELLVAALADRWSRAQKSCLYASVFRNRGRAAGASLAHPHTQLAGVDWVPERIRDQLRAFREGFDPSRLPRERPELVAWEDEWLLMASPWPRFRGECWLVPAEPVPSLVEADAGALGRALSRAVADMKARLGMEDYNVLFKNPPRSAEGWVLWVELLPRGEGPGGFELDTGNWLVPTRPEDVAEALRG